MSSFKARLTFAKPNRFQRGPLAGCPASASGADLDPSLAPPATCISRDSSAKLEAEAYAHTAPSDLSVNSPVIRAAPDNVVVLPGSGTPYGLRYGLADDLSDGSSNGNGHLPWRRH